jgi:hypothetical protein
VSGITLSPYTGAAADILPYNAAGVPQARTLNLQATGFDVDGTPCWFVLEGADLIGIYYSEAEAQAAQAQ